ncbi:MAG: type II/IV secretion system protein [Leptolyngbyaceae cyanobacterium CSU_1_3]|nr:type II/IV secretion system protein [Leptolyngbyaceae cyanobacterium CSU_1_3]
MQTLSRPTSAFHRLKHRDISCEAALQLLVDAEGVINFELLDVEVSDRFFRQVGDRSALPLVPLLLWRNCYYLGSPIVLSQPQVQQLRDRCAANISVIAISEKSYQDWYRLQHTNGNQINGAEYINPLTGKQEQEDIAQTTELYLAQTDNQIERIKTIIAGALRNRASDIHLEPTADGLRVRYRIDGILRHVTTLPPAISRKVIVSLKVMCDMDISESRRPQDGRIGEKYVADQQQELGLDLRVSTIPCVSGKKGEPGEKAVLRLLRQDNSFSTIEDLGFSEATREIYRTWLEQPQGMVILTGPTGSGKTSTLYTSLQAVSKDSVNIVTVEDPVEYVLPGITQTQVNEAVGMTFAAGLRAILRQDPDVIMLGEIRDHETAETAVRAALTGHLVLTTLHTNDAIGAIPRLKDIGPDPGLISDALLGVVAQRLVRRVCPHCAETYEPTEADLRLLGLRREAVLSQTWRRGRGCSHCFHSGYLGREAIIEVLNVDDTVRQLIHEGSTTQLNQYLQESGFYSFRQAAIEKVTMGITTVEEVRRVLPHSSLCRSQTVSSFTNAIVRLAG